MEVGGEKGDLGVSCDQPLRPWHLGREPKAGLEGGQGSSPVRWPLSSPSLPPAMYTVLGHLPPGLSHT